LTATSRSPAWRRPVAIALVAVAGIVVALAVAVLAVRLAHDGEALPGTRIAGIEAGGLTAEQLRARLRGAADPQRQVVVLAGDQRLRVAAAQAGYEVDLGRSVDAALGAGRDGLLGGAFATLEGLVSTREVELEATVDADRLDRAVAALARQIDRPSFPGRLEISADGAQVVAEPPRAGRRLDRAVLRERLRAALLGLASGPVRAPVAQRPVVSQAQVDAVAADAERFLSEPLILTGGGEPLTVEPARLAPVLALEPRAGGRRVRLGVDQAELDGLVAEVASARDRPARDATVEAPARAEVVDGKEDLTWSARPAGVAVTPARAGRTVDREQLAAEVERAVVAGSHRATLPVERVEPEVTTRTARRMTDLIGTFTTYYEAGQPRVTNIQRIAAAVDGTVIPPGGSFSLNGIAGERTREKGYVPAPFIADGRLVPSVGGGVSQFATTIYNAAFLAGLQLDTSQPHSAYIDRYPAGREATLNFPDIDLAWTNDTDAPVLVRTHTDDAGVTVSLYGDNGGRVVSAETGARQPSGDGFSIEVTRVIRRPGGETTRTSRTTTYEPLDE